MLSGFVVDKPAQDPVVVSQQTGMLVVRQVEHRGQGIDGDVGLRVPALFLMVLPMGVPGEADGGGLEVEDLMVPVQLGQQTLGARGLFQPALAAETDDICHVEIPPFLQISNQ